MAHWQSLSMMKIEIKNRNRDSYKGTYGAAYLFAGSRGMMGAALLSARACMRSGIGLLTVHTAACGYPILQLGIPEAKCEPDFSESHITDISVPDKINAVGIGPGIGQSPETVDALAKFIQAEKCLAGNAHRLVIDADGLNILAANPKLAELLPQGTILTPHPGEFKRLKNSIPDLEKLGLVLVLKSAFTEVIDSATGEKWKNTEYGNSGMAVGGSGDILTGIILSLLAQGYEPFSAACTGVCLHSLAADIALENQSEESLLPSDIIANLGNAFKTLKNKSINQ